MIGKQAVMKQLASNITESEEIKALVAIIAEIEHRQLAAVEELHEALDVDGLQVTKDRDQRREQLLDVVDAAAPGGSLLDLWFEQVAPEHIDAPEDAKSYAGLSSEEWQQQQTNWAAAYRDRIEGDHTDEELAEQHVQRKFGVSLDEFEREVIGYSDADALRTLLGGNFEAVEQGIAQATEAAKAGE